jgi:ribosomal protein S18 acetylase RimI-like enzyme
LKGDAEYDPALCFIAVDDQDQIVGVAQCWTSAFLKDLAVSLAFRRRGLGSALLLTVFQAFQERGAEFVDLKVEADNPTGAVRLYGSHGMWTLEAYTVD